MNTASSLQADLRWLLPSEIWTGSLDTRRRHRSLKRRSPAMALG